MDEGSSGETSDSTIEFDATKRKEFLCSIRDINLTSLLIHHILDTDLRSIVYMLDFKKVSPNFGVGDCDLTPMHIIAQNENVEFVQVVLKIFVQHGGNPNVQSKEGYTPLHMAALANNQYNMRLLIQYGANILMKDSNNFTPFQLHDYVRKIDETTVNVEPNTTEFHSLTLSSDSSVMGRGGHNYPTRLLRGRMELNKSESSISTFFGSDNHDSKPIFNNIESILNCGYLYATSSGSSVYFSECKTNKSSSEEPDSDCDDRFENCVCPSPNFQHKKIDTFPTEFISHNYGKETETSYSNLLNVAILNERNQAEFSDVDSLLNCAYIYVSPRGSNVYSTFEKNNSTFKKPNNVLELSGVFPFKESDDEPLDAISEFNPEPDQRSQEPSDANSTLSSCPTQVLRQNLKALKITHGPIVKTTKKLYMRKVHNEMKIGRPFALKKPSLGFNEVMKRALNQDIRELHLKWVDLEQDFVAKCKNPTELAPKLNPYKVFFTYLLLDPRILGQVTIIPTTSEQFQDFWKVFVSAIFYVGKGKNARPMHHLVDAINSHQRVPSKKIQRIREIWSSGDGIICVQGFNFISEVEAFLREAFMIRAVSNSQLTNVQKGQFLGEFKKWPLHTKYKLGVVLLLKMMYVFIAEGMNKIFPSDLETPK